MLVNKHNNRMNFFMILFLKTIQYIENFKLWGFLHKIKKNGEELNKSKNKLKKTTTKNSKSFEYAPTPALDDKEILREMIIFDH